MDDLGPKLAERVTHFSGVRVMVVGDLVADHYVLAEPARLSREAPVVVTRFESEHLIPGGAANAVRNLAALGACVLPVGIIGDDRDGHSLLESLGERNIDTAGVIVADGHPTVTKTRFLVGEQQRTKQQIFRMDREPSGPPPASALERVLAFVEDHLSEVDALLLSDYGYGVVTEAFVRRALERSDRPHVSADSRYAIRTFKGVDLATPNVHEVEAALGRPIGDDADLNGAGEWLLDELDAEGLIITRGNQGMSLFRPGLPRVDIPATGVDEVTDVSGAGDTVIAVATLACASGADLLEASLLANLAAGIVVTKVGPATCSPAEMREAAGACLEGE